MRSPRVAHLASVIFSHTRTRVKFWVLSTMAKQSIVPTKLNFTLSRREAKAGEHLLSFLMQTLTPKSMRKLTHRNFRHQRWRRSREEAMSRNKRELKNQQPLDFECPQFCLYRAWGKAGALPLLRRLRWIDVHTHCIRRKTVRNASLVC